MSNRKNKVGAEELMAYLLDNPNSTIREMASHFLFSKDKAYNLLFLNKISLKSIPGRILYSKDSKGLKEAIEHYISENPESSMNEIALFLNCTPANISKVAKKFSIALPKKTKKKG